MEQYQKEQLDEANKLIFVKQYDAASKILSEVAGEGKEASMLVHLRRIELGAKLKRLEDLRQEYLRRSEAHPENISLQLCLILIEQHAESISTDEAVGRFQEILKIDSANAVAYYGIGFSMEMQGNIDRAIYNYEQSINFDSEWYPSFFGLSQLHYQKGDHENGDHYFFLFENAAPYNVYGNFETHRALTKEFIQRERFDEAENAIVTLSEWWVDNKGRCPLEIQLHESLAIAEIASLQGETGRANSRQAMAHGMVERIMSDPSTNEGVVYFCAKILEEYGEMQSALEFYKFALRMSGGDPSMIQKIGSQFLAMGEYDLARELFEDAYQAHPDNPEIRFCVLVSNLKLAGVNVEDYLIGKERLKQLNASGTDKVEVLALLHSLLAKFKDDPEVHHQIGDVYLRMGNVSRAASHYKKMYDLDGKSRSSSLKYASFLMQNDNPEKALEILESISDSAADISFEDQMEMNWLKASYYARLGEFKKSQEFLNRVTKNDPWNISYIVQDVINRTMLAPIDTEYKEIDDVIHHLSNLNETNLDWKQFDEITDKFEQLMVLDVAYSRRKIRYLYTEDQESVLQSLVNTACHYDASQGTYDFLKLINTNFDSPEVYRSLGVLHKELWQLEVASMWFEQCMMHRSITEELKADCYAEIADCYIWLSKDLNRAIEYVKLSLDMVEKPVARCMNTLVHAYLKTGQVKRAEAYLSQSPATGGIENRFLNGLLEYRNGARKKANEIWKPLLTFKSESLRDHNIKQEVLKYYFDGAPYLNDLKVN